MKLQGLLDYAQEVWDGGARPRQVVRGLLSGNTEPLNGVVGELKQLFDPEYMSQVKPMSRQDMMNLALDVNPVMALSTKAVKSIPKTQHEIAHDVAQKNAVDMLGLPPNNTAMDRAKAMGFDVDTPMYHGTGSDFGAFNVNGSGKTTGAGAFLTNNPIVAETYTPGLGRTPRIMPLLAKKGNLLEVNAKGHNWNDIYTNGLTHKRKRLTDIFPDDLSPNDFTTTDELAQLSKYGGFGGVKIKNVKDIGPNSHQYRMKEYLENKYNIPASNSDDYWDAVSGSQFAESREAANKLYSKQKSDILALQEPSMIRSRFAAFDPARANEADLLGYSTPEMMGLLGLLSGAGVGYAYNKKDSK